MAKPATMGGPALCVCSVIASWRCLLCDTPVCDQHRNRFWPGQARDNIRLRSTDEHAIWYTAVDGPPATVRLGASEACTVCRAQLAANLLDRYRSIPQPLPAGPFERLYLLARHGIWTWGFFIAPDASHFLHGLARFQYEHGVPEQSIAQSWRTKAGSIHRVASPVGVRVFQVGRSQTTLLFRPTEGLISGPLVLQNTPKGLIATANQRDVTRHQYAVKYAVNGAPLDYATYFLRWRPIGYGPSDLGLDSYQPLITPLL